MSDLLYEVSENIACLTLNRIDKHNAFNASMLSEMQALIKQAEHDPKVRVLILKANGKHFSAGADLDWMRNMVSYSEEENLQDSLILSNLMKQLHHCPIPTIAMVQGAAFGGGAGLVAACDIAIASESARFCFSEVKLGLIPAVISPYVMKAIGERTAKMLFISAEIFSAQQALHFHLVHHCVKEIELLPFTMDYAATICKNAPKAVQTIKALSLEISNKPIDSSLTYLTATKIAQQRVSEEAQEGMKAFLNKQSPSWNKGSEHV